MLPVGTIANPIPDAIVHAQLLDLMGFNAIRAFRDRLYALANNLPANLTFCSNEWETCSASGLKTTRFGVDGATSTGPPTAPSRAPTTSSVILCRGRQRAARSATSSRTPARMRTAIATSTASSTSRTVGRRIYRQAGHLRNRMQQRRVRRPEPWRIQELHVPRPGVDTVRHRGGNLHRLGDEFRSLRLRRQVPILAADGLVPLQ